MMMEIRELAKFWGKTGEPVCGGPDWHPCVFHCLDVAASAQELLRHHPKLETWLADELGWVSPAAKNVWLQLMFLHDVGKLSLEFQSLSPKHYPSFLKPWHEGLGHQPNHTQCGDIYLEELMREAHLPWADGLDEEILALMRAPFAGHHGRPVQARRRPARDPSCRAGVAAMVELAQALFPVDGLAEPEWNNLARASWVLAGLAVTSDWLGSSRTFFPFTEHSTNVHDYWKMARERASTAVFAAGLMEIRPSAGQGFADIFDTDHSPTATQRWSEAVTLGEGPALFIIEDVTGSGKTEAAVILARRLMQAGQATGIYVALPTMATANAMFERMSTIYRRLFDGEASLTLAHSARHFHEGFAQVRLTGQRRPIIGDEDDDGAGDGSGAVCTAWIADSGRKTFLAQLGVGTIDQALLAVLPAKYQSLRLFGLAQRVLIVDEAHAYDAYMRTELERLLEFHAGLGGSAIVLSATLPQTTRRGLLGAFAKGCEQSMPSPNAVAYPLTSFWQEGALHEAPQAARPDLTRELVIERLGSADEAMMRIVTAAGEGKAVAWVRNTVDDAIEAFDELRMRGVNAELFHARFTLHDRMMIEQAAVERFGKSGTVAQRQGHVLVATQVIEQSLDLDFDLMVSDLAPVDLLLQRAGRVCRHRRGHRAPPRLLVLAPNPTGEIDEDWLARVLPRAVKIYPDHALLWRTAHQLFTRSSLLVPEDVRDLIETVYDFEGEVPPALQRSTDAAIGANSSARVFAHTNLLPLMDGYAPDTPAPWDSDQRVPTRLGDPRITLRLGRLEARQIVPFHRDENPARAWALSEINVRQGFTREVISPELTDAAARAKNSWGRYDQDKLLLVMATATELEPVWHYQSLTYSSSMGLAGRANNVNEI
ncbi:MAG: CRISPR-associated helicase Cas3' [Geminicoccaceae bacterium]